jgi:hypothetical protein
MAAQAYPRSGLAPRQVALAMAAVFAVASAILAAIRWVDAGPIVTIGYLPLLYGALTFTAVGVIVLWRRPGQGIGRLALIIGLAYGVGIWLQTIVGLVDPPESVRTVHLGVVPYLIYAATVLAEILQMTGLLLGCTLMISWFPSGRRSSRTGILVELALAIGVIGMLASAVREPLFQAVGWSAGLQAIFDTLIGPAFAAFMAAFVLAVLDLALRYRSAEGVLRTQIRWVLAASAVALIGALGASGLLPFSDGMWDIMLLTLMLPVAAVAVAITRYHLYDIDRIVSRTIGYAIVTAILFGVFALVNLGLQTVLSGVVGSPPLLVAASTLTVAALFNPLRRRVQTAVDRRFHRSHYDAQLTVDGFAGRLRDQLDLTTLSTELRQTTVEAVEPSATGIWLRGVVR